MNPHARGQATIELLLILAVLFIILGYSLQTFLTNQNIVNQKRAQLDAERNAIILRSAIEQIYSAPTGSSQRVFLPPASQDQNIRLINGVVEVRTSSLVFDQPTLIKDLNSSTFHDGNIIIITHTPSGVTLS